MVEAVQVEVLLHLPVLVPEAGALRRVAVEQDALPGCDDRVPPPSGRAEPGVRAGVGVVGPDEDVQEIVAEVALRKAVLDEGPVVRVAPVQVAGGKVRADVPGDDPAVAGEVPGDLPDVLHEALDGFVRAVADAVVEGAPGQLGLHHRADVEVEVPLEDLPLHEAGDDLAGPRLPDHEGVKERNKGAVVEVVQEPNQVTFPVQLEVHAVGAPPLVRAAAHVGVQDGLQVHVLVE